MIPRLIFTISFWMGIPARMCCLKFMEFDNSRFINFLKKRGFYVASQSHSNYGQTALSLSSSLNFNYLEARMELLPKFSDRGPLVNLINDNDVRRFLKKAGYRTVAFNNGFPVTEMVQADEFIQESDGLNNFEISLLLDSLGGQELTEPILDSYRQRILGTEEKLKSLVNDPEAGPEPKFVFAHFILPHPPFVFQADGSPRLSLDSGDGSHYSGLPEDYWSGYREQVQYADRMAEEIITYILEHSQREPIIIIQGDHGSGYHLDWESQENSCLRERFSILNAYYLPGKKKVNLYSSITPVNSFRVVFNAYFKANLPMLPDRLLLFHLGPALRSARGDREVGADLRPIRNGRGRRRSPWYPGTQLAASPDTTAISYYGNY